MFAYVDRRVGEGKRFQRLAIACLACGSQQPSHDSNRQESATGGKIHQGSASRILEKVLEQLLRFFIFSGEPCGKVVDGRACRRHVALGDVPHVRITQSRFQGAYEHQARAADGAGREVRFDFFTLRNTARMGRVLLDLVFGRVAHERSDRAIARAFFRHRWRRKRM